MMIGRTGRFKEVNCEEKRQNFQFPVYKQSDYDLPSINSTYTAKTFVL